MSRPLIIAAFAASALHVAVLAAMGHWRAEGRIDAIGSQPILLALAELPHDAPLIPPDWAIETTRPQEPAIEAPAPPADTPEPQAVEIAHESEAGLGDFNESPVQAAPEPDAMAALKARDEPEHAESAERRPPTLEVAEETQPDASPAVTQAAPTEELVEETSVTAVVVHSVGKAPAQLMALLSESLERARRAARALALPPTPAAAPERRGERLEPAPEHRPKPHYPAIARRRGYQGTVLLRIEVLEDGRVGRVVVAGSSGHDVLDRQAQQTVREQWRFKAGSSDGRATTQWIEIPIEFRLTDSR